MLDLAGFYTLSTDFDLDFILATVKKFRHEIMSLPEYQHGQRSV